MNMTEPAYHGKLGKEVEEPRTTTFANGYKDIHFTTYQSSANDSINIKT